MANNFMTQVPDPNDDNQPGMMTPDVDAILKKAALDPRFNKNLRTPTPEAMEGQMQSEDTLTATPKSDTDNANMLSGSLLDKFEFLKNKHPEVYNKSLRPYLKDQLASDENKKMVPQAQDESTDDSDKDSGDDNSAADSTDNGDSATKDHSVQESLDRVNAAKQPVATTTPQPSTSVPQQAAPTTTPLMQRLLDAQNQADRNRAGANMSAYAQLAGESFQHKNQDALQKQIQANEQSQVNVPIDKLNQQIALDKEDPNSQASQNFRQLLAQKYKIDPTKMQGMSMDQIIKVAPMFEKDATAELRNQYQMLAMQQKNDLAQQGFQNKNDLLQSRLDTQRDLANMHNDFNYDKLDAGANSAKDKQAVKQTADDEKEIAKATKEANGMSASSRSVIGNAEKIKFAAKRLNDILDDPNATTEDMSSVAADMNGLISGTTTMGGTSHAEYNTLQSTLAKGLQYITSNPVAPNIPEVKQHIKDVANRMMKLSDDVQSQHLNRVLVGRKPLFDRHPTARQDLIDSITGKSDLSQFQQPGPDASNATPNQSAQPASSPSTKSNKPSWAI